MISPQTAHARQHLPTELTSFVGRCEDIEAVSGFLATSRLVTIVGPGGVGKTRLAMRVLDDCATLGGLRTCVVDLTEGGSALAALAELTQTTAGPSRPELLVLDTCEHVVDACAAWVLDFLESTPGARVVAVSRRPLGVKGEQLWRLDPLGVPPPGAGFHDLDTFPGVQLLVDRLDTQQPGFELTVQNAPLIAHICRAASGVPLALEHAAEQIALLGLEVVAHEHPSSALFGMPTITVRLDRHVTLRADFDWAWPLLSTSDQHVLARLSVFADGFTLAAAEYVCSAPGTDAASLLDSLERLVETSFVQFESQPAPHGRYRLLNTTRSLLAETLQTTELHQLQDRLTEWLQALADGIDASTMELSVVQPLADEWGNLRAVFALAADADADAEQRARALRLCVACYPLWGLLNPQEGATWLSRLRDAECMSIDPVLFARASSMSGMFAVYVGDAQQAIAQLRVSLPTLEQCGDHFGAVRTRYFLAEAYRLAGDLAAAREELTALWKAPPGRQHPLASGLQARLALVLLDSGELPPARQHAQQALRNATLNGHPWCLTRAKELAARLALHDGDFEAATGAFREAISYAHECREPFAWVAPTFELADTYLRTVDSGRAASVLLDLLRATAGLNALTLAHLRRLAAVLAQLLDLVRPEQAAWFRGVATRLSSTSDATSASSSMEVQMLRANAESVLRSLVANTRGVHTATRSLTTREMDVARLTVDGLTNRQIARELSLSEGTVRAHMGHILEKLDLRSRVQISSWLTQLDDERQPSQRG